MSIEFRSGHGLGFSSRYVELRASGAGRRLEGLAVPYNVEAHFGGVLTEVVRPGAFTRSLESGKDILCLADHDPAKLLGRTGNKTLTLRDSPDGLLFEVELPETTAAYDILALARRGDLGGCSFGFTCGENCDLWSGTERQLMNVDLLEISIVSSWPAYTQTSVAARCRTGSGKCDNAPIIALPAETPCDCDDAQDNVIALHAARRFLETL